MQLPIPNDWNGTDYCRWSVCWPNSSMWKAILNGLLEMPAQGRFWDGDTGSIIGVQADFRATYDYNFYLSEVIMACGDNGLQSVATSLLAIANSLASSRGSGGECQCGCSAGFSSYGIPQEDGTNIPIYGTQPPMDLPPSGLPPGYTDLVVAQRDRCAQATALVDGLAASLLYLGALDVFNLTALASLLGASLAGLAPALVFPPAAIPIIIGALVALGLLMGVLIDCRSYVLGHREELICMLYNTNSTQDVIGLYSDFVDTMIAFLELNGPVGFAVKTIMLVLWNTDTLNKMVTAQGAASLPDGACDDCSGCNPALGWLLGSGDLTIDGNARDWTSGLLGENNTQYCRVSHESCCNVGVTVNSFSGPGVLVWETPFQDCGSDNKTIGVVQFGVEYPYGKDAQDYFLTLSNGISSGFTVNITLRAL